MITQSISSFKSIARTLAIGAVLLLLGGAKCAAVVVVGPFLEGATTTNIYVLAECSVGASSPMTVNYGTTAGYGFSATTSFVKTSAGTTNVHRIKLTNLAPDTLYHYQLVGQGLTSPDYTFRTLVGPGNNFKFVWQADFRTGTAMHETIANLVRLSAPLFVLEGGDTCEFGDFPGWHNEYFSPNEKELGKWFPIYPTPGNHETWGTLTQAYFQSPDSTGANGYYSFDCGDVHITMANYQTTCTVGSAQYNWIQQDVQASLKPWKIFGTHAPAYTYGSHGNNADFVAITSNILEPNGVKVFLGGHNHFYQHNLVNGIRHLTVGAAGAPLATTLSNATYTIKTMKTNCYLVAEASATNLHMVVYQESNAILDVIDLYKPAAPTSVVASPGNFSAALNWDAVPRATNYTVYYGLSNGGPYPSRKISVTTNTTVAGLVNATTYYFVVTASDTNGPSAVSAQVSAVPVFVAPQIALTSPVDSDSFIAPASVNLAAVVTTNGNTINRVQFYQNATNLIAEDFAPPYAFAWSNVSAGTYPVKARLVYNTSSTLDSAIANVTVVNPPVMSSFAFEANGDFKLGGSGAPGQDYVLLTATNVGPGAVWSPILTNTADGTGLFQFVDLMATNFAQRFYRVTTP